MKKNLEIFKKLESNSKYTKENFVFIYKSKKSNVIFKNYSNNKNISYLGIFLTDVQHFYIKVIKFYKALSRNINKDPTK